MERSQKMKFEICYQDIIASQKQHTTFDLVELPVHAWQLTKTLYPVDHGLQAVYADIDQSLRAHNWAQSYQRPQVIYTSQELTPWVLECLQTWLRHQSGNIENVFLIVTGHLGLGDWWHQTMTVRGESTFNVIEWLDINSCDYRFYYNGLEQLPSSEWVKTDKDIKHFFCWYGGNAVQALDKFYRNLRIMELSEYGIVEALEDFNIGRQKIIDHVEYLGYFKNQKAVDTISNLYDQYVVDNKLVYQHKITVPGVKQRNEPIDFESYQYQVDRLCFACIIRETIDHWQFATVTEKTIRTFIHHMVAIPLGYKSVHHLEKFGFWFPHDIIDYSYQHQADYLTRFDGMVESVKCTLSQYTISDLDQYYKQNFDKFRANAELCVRYYQGEFV